MFLLARVVVRFDVFLSKEFRFIKDVAMKPNDPCRTVWSLKRNPEKLLTFLMFIHYYFEKIQFCF